MKIFVEGTRILGLVNDKKGIAQIDQTLDKKKQIWDVFEVEDDTLPDDYVGGKYFYVAGEFVLNLEYVAPPEELIKSKRIK